MAARRRSAPDRRKPSIFWFFSALVTPPLELMFKFEIDGKLPLTGPIIITPNHYSDLDPITTGYAVWKLGRAPRFMAKASLFKVPVVGKLLTASGQIPVERERSAAKTATMDAARTLVRTGNAVIIYPEGTLTREPDGWPMRGKSGAVRIALEAGIPIIPVATTGADAVMPRFARTKRFRMRFRTPVRVKVGEPIDLSAYAGKASSRKAVTEATELVMREITALLEDLRGEKAPTELYDPAKHGQSEFGMPVPVPPKGRGPASAPVAEARAADATPAAGAADAAPASKAADGAATAADATPASTDSEPTA